MLRPTVPVLPGAPCVLLGPHLHCAFCGPPGQVPPPHRLPFLPFAVFFVPVPVAVIPARRVLRGASLVRRHAPPGPGQEVCAAVTADRQDFRGPGSRFLGGHSRPRDFAGKKSRRRWEVIPPPCRNGGPGWGRTGHWPMLRPGTGRDCPAARLACITCAAAAKRAIAPRCPWAGCAGIYCFLRFQPPPARSANPSDSRRPRPDRTVAALSPPTTHNFSIVVAVRSGSASSRSRSEVPNPS